MPNASELIALQHRPPEPVAPNAAATARAERTTDWLTADEAFAFVGLPSRRALYMAVRRGQIPVHRLGRRMRFSARELDDTLRRAGPRPFR